MLTEAYRASFFQAASLGLASARAGNVIGGGDWSPDRLLPDIIRSCIDQSDLTVRNPASIRPWQHVLDPLSGYLLLAEKLFHDSTNFAQAWNFGPFDHEARPVAWIVDYVTQHWHRPINWRQNNLDQLHETQRLRLDCSKAMDALGWRPRWSLEKALIETIKWYEAYEAQACLRHVTVEQIKQFMHLNTHKIAEELIEI